MSSEMSMKNERYISLTMISFVTVQVVFWYFMSFSGSEKN